MSKPLLRSALLVALACFLVGARMRAAEPTHGGKPVSHWIAAATSSDTEEWLEAEAALRNMRGDAVPYLTDAIRRSDGDARIRLLFVLEWIGPSAESAVPLLLELLGHQSAEVRITAAGTIVAIDCSQRRTALPVLIRGLKEDPQVASRAAISIGALGADGAPAVPALVEALRGRDARLRLEAAGALWRIGPAAKQAIPALKEMAREGGVLGAKAETAMAAIQRR